MSALDHLISRRTRASVNLARRLEERDGLLLQPISDVFNGQVCVRGRWLLNFASTDYLGLGQHARLRGAIRCGMNHRGLGAVSLGMPRILAVDQLTEKLESDLAQWVGQEAALIFPSTSHIASDILPILAGRQGILLVDHWAYPISKEGARTAAQLGANIRHFPHNDVTSLARLLDDYAPCADKVIICDGVYSAGGGSAALREMVQLARKHDAIIYVDDAHGIGLLGSGPTRAMPYGFGGAGSPSYHALPRGNLIHVGSLSKAFGVPVAFIAGPSRFVEFVRRVAGSHIHSSPPALPILMAAQAALQVNVAQGNQLRRHLFERVQRFRQKLSAVHVRLDRNNVFPIQFIGFDGARKAEDVGRRLRRAGIWPVVQFQPADHPHGAAVRFVITARHSNEDLDEATMIIGHCVGRGVGHRIRR